MIFHLLSLGNSIFNRWHSYPCFRGVAPCTGQCLLQTMNWQQTTLPRSKGTSGKLVVSTNDNIAVEGSQGSIFLALMVTCALHRLATWRWRPLFQQTHIPAPCKITRTKRQLQPCKFQLKVSLEPKESTAQGTCRAAGTICGFTEGCQGHQCGFTEKRHNYCLMPATALPLRVRHAGDGGIFGPSVPATAASLVPVTLPRREGADAQCPVRIWNIWLIVVLQTSYSRGNVLCMHLKHEPNFGEKYLPAISALVCSSNRRVTIYIQPLAAYIVKKQWTLKTRKLWLDRDFWAGPWTLLLPVTAK